MTQAQALKTPTAPAGRRWPRWRMCWTGFVLCVLYLYLCVTCIWMAGGLSAATTEWHRTWLWYPLAPQTWVLDHVGLGWVMDCTSWRNAYLGVGGGTLPVLFALGVGAERLVRHVWSKRERSPSDFEPLN
ncbi:MULTISPECIES: hypothetical protein [unclassified Rhizobacter]|uniref:hypothetical protein n=1 Tax=unclassified Rhizobacter TaxID=2640088 RepID=UPI000AE06417|nr:MULTISPECIES: hypothetical protein [unclassified Rhizobacter]